MDRRLFMHEPIYSNTTQNPPMAFNALTSLASALAAFGNPASRTGSASDSVMGPEAQRMCDNNPNHLLQDPQFEAVAQAGDTDGIR